MKRFFASGIVLILFYVVGCAGGETADPDTARQEIEARNQMLQTYLQQQNVDSVLTIYSSDAVILPQGAPMVRGQQDIRTSLQGMFDMGFSGVEFETIEVEVAGDYAFEVGTYVARGPGGAEMDHGKYLSVWKNEDGEWKLHRDIYNTDMAAPDTMTAPADTAAVDTSET